MRRWKKSFDEILQFSSVSREMRPRLIKVFFVKVIHLITFQNELHTFSVFNLKEIEILKAAASSFQNDKTLKFNVLLHLKIL